jgi:hypothetical protein
MKTLTIRDIPEDTYGTVVRLAERNRRSIQQQVIVLLDRARVLERPSPLLVAREIREQLASREKLGDTVRELREDRDR